MYRLINFIKNGLIPDTWQSIEPCDVLLVAHDNDRGFFYKKKPYSQILDSLSYFYRKDFRFSYISSASTKYRANECFADVKSYNRFLLKIYVKGVSTRIKSLKKYIRTQKIFFWTEVLKKSNASIVIAIQPSKELCIAGHNTQVAVYDFQHGVINDSMLQYGEKYLTVIDAKELPKGYLCWDTSSSDVLKKWTTPKGIEVHVIGHPWLARFYKKDVNDTLIQTELKIVSESMSLRENLPSILVTLQWNLSSFYPNEFTDDQAVHKDLVEVIKATKNNWNWLLRLHPIQVKNAKIYSQICKEFSNVEGVYIKEPSKAALPSVLSIANAHITWDSSTVIEAAQFGVKSFVINPSYFSEGRSNAEIEEENFLPEDLPYFYYEKNGLVTRTQKIVSKEQMVSWLAAINNKADESILCSQASLFEKDKLLGILKNRIDTYKRNFSRQAMES